MELRIARIAVFIVNEEKLIKDRLELSSAEQKEGRKERNIGPVESPSIAATNIMFMFTSFYGLQQQRITCTSLQSRA